MTCRAFVPPLYYILDATILNMSLSKRDLVYDTISWISHYVTLSLLYTLTHCLTLEVVSGQELLGRLEL